MRKIFVVNGAIHLATVFCSINRVYFFSYIMDVAKEYHDLAERNEPEADENCYGISNYSFFL